MGDKKVLFFLDASNPINRVIRRGVMVAVLTFVAILLKDGIMPIVGDGYIAIITAILVAIDKAVRENWKE